MEVAIQLTVWNNGSKLSPTTENQKINLIANLIRNPSFYTNIILPFSAKWSDIKKI